MLRVVLLKTCELLICESVCNKCYCLRVPITFWLVRLVGRTVSLTRSFTIYVVNFLDQFLVDCNITSKSFNFPKKYKLPFYFVSASDGTNVVKVSVMTTM